MNSLQIFSASLLIFTGWAQSATSVWVEGEAASEKAVKKHGWYSDVKEGDLSGSDFLSHWGDDVGTATYQVEIPESGDYAIWFRANPVGSKFEIQFEGGEWSKLDFGNKSREKVNIARDNQVDLRILAWVSAGKKSLKAGGQEIKVRFTSSNNHHGMLDCFCLTTDQEWTPQLTLKPGEEPKVYPIPKISEKNLSEWIKFVRPSRDELGWRAIRWHRSLSEAAAEAKNLKRPILLWAMNGHPCGET